jgi:hypothetical protein
MKDQRLSLAEEEELEEREAEEAEESESSEDNELSVVSLEEISDTPEERVKKICEFLIEVIGDDPDVMEMETYGQEFWKLGFHSVSAIIAHITADDLEWMKPLHKLRLLERANLQKLKDNN